MRGHFKHLRFKTFLMVSCGPNLVLVFLSNQGFKQLPHECNSQSKSELGSHWASSFAFSPICEGVFHTSTDLRPHGPFHFTLYCEPNVRVVTVKVVKTIIITNSY